MNVRFIYSRQDEYRRFPGDGGKQRINLLRGKAEEKWKTEEKLLPERMQRST